MAATAERRTARDPSIAYEAEVLEAVVRKAGGRVHLVGHSFGGLVALAVALRKQVPLASLVIVEAPAAEMLRDATRAPALSRLPPHDGVLFRRLRGWEPRSDRSDDRLLRRRRHVCLLAAAGPRLRSETTTRSTSSIGRVRTVFRCRRHRWLPSRSPFSSSAGGASHPAVQRANALLSERMRGAALATIDGAAHFMITSHANQVARLIARHVHGAEVMPIAPAA